MATSNLVNDLRTVYRAKVSNEICSNMDHKTTQPTCSQKTNVGNSVISVQNLCKSYGEGKQTLKNLSMTVNKGTIHSLLGSSGCGKSTLLSCVVGLRKWDSGEILLFGRSVNGPPGKKVGYMPQDVALHDTLSVRETMTYFGCLYGMRNDEIEKKWNWIADFLHLPTTFSLVGNLSGGQQRRVSLAVTLIHSPELLILDEPTVGMDPLLRESIWGHLRSITATGKTTVIITTHYVEETRSSGKIGLIRNGRLIVEDTPTNLLQQHECLLLEQVVLKLCVEDNGAELPRRGWNGKVNFDHSSMTAIDEELVSQKMEESANHSWGDDFQEISPSNVFGRVTALSKVIWLLFIRNSTFMIMIILLPTFQIMLTLAAQGMPPKGLKFGVINQDADTHRSCNYNSNMTYDGNVVSSNLSSCNIEHLSCHLISELSKSETFTLTSLESTQIAQKEVELGNMWGYFEFPNNYSQHLSNLALEKMFAENITLEKSRVHLFMDMSSYLITMVSTNDAFEAYQRFLRNFAFDCGINPLEFQLPLAYREPIHKNTGNSLHEHFIPVVLLGILFEITVLMTSVLFINDRKQGTLSRALVAGVRFNNVFVSHIVTQSSLVIAQTVLFLFILYFVYGVRIAGSYVQFFVLCFLGGLCGQSFGILLGVFFEQEIEAMMIGILIMMSLYIYEGCFWPVQGMTVGVRNIAYCLPTTLLVESIRSTIYRGVGILSNFVWPGVAVTIFWTTVFWIISILVFRRQLI